MDILSIDKQLTNLYKRISILNEKFRDLTNQTEENKKIDGLMTSFCCITDEFIKINERADQVYNNIETLSKEVNKILLSD